MGWSFRKRVNLGGGVKLNLSKRGVGVSFGVKGARWSIGPRGVYAYGGWGPFRYQKKISGSRSGQATAGSKQTCGSCGYQWSPRGRIYSVRCPNCGVKFSSISSTSTSSSGCSGCLLVLLLILGGLFLFSLIGSRQTLTQPDPAAQLPTESQRLATLPIQPQSNQSANSQPIAVPETAQLPIIEATHELESDPEVEVEKFQVRKWTDTTGNFSTIAVLTSFDGTTVCMTKDDGNEISVPLAKLCAEDQAYVQDIAGMHTLLGKVIGISDGNNITVLDGNNRPRRCDYPILAHPTTVKLTARRRGSH